MLKLKYVLYRLEEYIVTDFLNAVVDCIKILFVIIFLSHIMGCIYFYIGTYDQYNPNNWVNQSKLDQDTKFEQYIWSIYFAFTTIASIGYGDILPYTKSERIYWIIWMIIATGTFGFITGALNAIFNRSDFFNKRYEIKN